MRRKERKSDLCGWRVLPTPDIINEKKKDVPERNVDPYMRYHKTSCS